MFWTSFRSLIRSWRFGLSAILTLGLGIGINVAVFAVANRILLGSLPYAKPDGLVVLYEYRGGTKAVGVPSTFVERIRRSTSLEGITLIDWDTPTLRTSAGDDGKPLTFVRSAFTTLKVLGIVPAVGRDFTEEDARQQRRLVMLSHDSWRTHFGGRSDVVGQLLWSSDPTAPPFEVSGVLPRGFIAPQLGAGKMWSGIALGWQIFESSQTRAYPPPVARLRKGVSLAEAQSEIDTLVTQMQPDFEREFKTALQFRLEPLPEVLLGKYRAYVAIVSIAAALVMLVACANMGALLMVRSRSRETRTAIQMALGASRRDLICELGLEALLLAGCACVLAVIVLAGVQQVLVSSLPPPLAVFTSPVLDVRVGLAAVAFTILTAVLSSVIPAWRMTGLDPLVLLRGRSDQGAGRLIGAGVLLTAEVALSSALAIGAVLTARTLSNIETSDVGFKPGELYTVSAFLPPNPDRALMLRQYLEMLELIRATPGVQSATGADSLPMIGIANRPMYRAAVGTQRCPVTDGFVDTLGMHLIAGRAVTSEDVARGNRVGVLSLSGLKFALPSVSPQEAIGRFLEFPGEAPRQVVGVVSDVQSQYLASSMPTLYVPIGSERLGAILFAVRVTPGATIAAAALDRRFESLSLKPQPARISPVATAFSLSITNQRFRARLFGTFGVVAVVLSMVGIYAVLAAVVAGRRHELGVRVALGATQGDIVTLVLRDAGGAVLPGIAAGIAVASWAGGFLEAMLFGIHARDLSTFAIVAVSIAFAAALAAWIPARRASRVDPARTTRQLV